MHKEVSYLEYLDAFSIQTSMHIFLYTFTTMENNWACLRRFPDCLLQANRISSPVRPQALIGPSLHSKNTPVPPHWREQDVPIFHRFNLSMYNYIDSHWSIQAFVFSFFHPLDCFFFCLSCFFTLTWQLVALNHLSVLLHCVYKPFLATTSSPASQGRLLLTPSQTVLIFTRLENTGRHQPWGDFFMLLGGKPTLVSGLKHNPTNQILQC